MKLQFLGGTGTVTGSKFYLHDKRHSWLVECGLFQGLKELRERNWRPLPFNVADLDAIILTHAHVDHSGYLPVVVRDGFQGPVFASEPTVELCKILLPDAGYVQEEDARYAAKSGFSKHHPPKPLYTYQDAVNSLSTLLSLSDDHKHGIGKGVNLTFKRAGHILGARFVIIEFTKMFRTFRILFTGDIGRYDSLMVVDPADVGDVDYIVLESTYGNREHEEEDVLTRFENIIKDTIAKNGKVIIPAFAVGRTQDILYILYLLELEGRLPDVPIFLNSPLAIDATEIYVRFMHEHKFYSDDQSSIARFRPSNLRIVHNIEDSKRLNSLDGPAIILSSAGMMTGGRILHHLKAYLPDENSTLIITGFQAQGTRGRLIKEGAKAVKIHGIPIAIRCNVEVINSLSAHGDRDDILKWLSHFKKAPKEVFLVHGEAETSKIFGDEIEKKFKWKVSVPGYGDEV
ncbi:MAG: MBL fold metallo-hydrolase, partial [Pseudomonadota bacterium]